MENPLPHGCSAGALCFIVATNLAESALYVKLYLVSFVATNFGRKKNTSFILQYVVTFSTWNFRYMLRGAPNRA